MMFATTTLLAAVLATLSPTNAPSSFGTETEQTFALPFIAERGNMVFRPCPRERTSGRDGIYFRASFASWLCLHRALNPNV